MTRVLMVLTSWDKLGDTGDKTGFFWEEMAKPYWSFRDAGLQVDLASVQGGHPPADPGSDDGNGQRTEAVQRFMDDADAMTALETTAKLADIDPSQYDAVFLPGGHGTMWDLRQTEAVGQAVSRIYERGGVVGAVCHGPAGLLGATEPGGAPLVQGKRVNGFTNSEEKAAGLDTVVPFLLEDALKEQGAKFQHSVEDFCGFAVRDGRLVTGQNPASSEMVAHRMLEALEEAGLKAA